MKSWLHQKFFRYFIAALSVIVLVIGLLVTTLTHLREEAIRTHRHVATLYASSIEEHFSQLLEHISLTLDRLPLLSNESPHDETLAPIFEEFLRNSPYVRSFSLANDEGILISSSNHTNVGKHLFLDSFLPIPFGENSPLRMGVPFQGRDFNNAKQSTPNSPILGTESTFIPLIKKIFFAGKLYYGVVNLNTDYFINRYSNLLPIEQRAISLWRLDGTLLFSTNTKLALGLLYDNRSFENEALLSYLDHLPSSRLNVQRLAKNGPFLVQIHGTESSILGYWDQERQKLLWITAVLMILSGGLSLTLLWRYEKESERQKEQIAYERQFRIAMEATQTGLWTWDLSTNALTWDAQCYLLLGYEPNTFSPTWETICELTHPDEAGSMFISIKEQLLAYASFLIERRMKNARDEWEWIQVRGKAIEFTDTHEPLLLTGVYINIDAQKKAEELHLSAVAFETQEAILITDASEKILKVNEAFTRITGYSDHEVLGKTPRIFRSGLHEASFYEAMWKSLLEKGFWQGELWNKRKDGEVYAEYLTITAIHNEQGKTSHYIANFSDITTRKVEQQQIAELAYYDPLTHLANRRMLLENLETTLQHASAEKHFGAILFIDLDYFKELNDTYGHDAGDMLLIQTGARLKECIRQSDLVARLGGDEFVILLKNLGHQRGIAIHLTQTIAKKILSYVCEPYALAQGNYRIGASIGCTLFGDDSRKDATQLLKEADTAMYQAKEEGRNRISIYETTLLKE